MGFVQQTQRFKPETMKLVATPQLGLVWVYSQDFEAKEEISSYWLLMS